MKEKRDPRIRVEKKFYCYGLWNHLISYYYSVEVLIDGEWRLVDWGYSTEEDAYKDGWRYLAQKGGAL